MIALIDGDVIVYAAGFASDSAAKRHKKELAEAGMDSSHMDDFEPLGHCLHGVDTMLNSITNAVGTDDYQVVLSGPTNTRETLFPEYKANRDTTHKPRWHSEIKDFLLNKRGALLSEAGDEADDALGIMHTDNPDSTIICTVDKDLDMVPGLHYNWSKTRRDTGIYTISEVEANRFFFTQVLSGDSTDNIPGMFQVLGVKCTEKYKRPIQSMDSFMDMYNYVLDVYKGDQEFVNLSGHLLWIKRHEGKTWVEYR